MKRFALILFCMLIAGTAQAYYLYWQIQSDPGGISAEYAQIVAVDGGGNETILKLADSTTGETTDVDLFELPTDKSWIDLGQLVSESSYSFYVELINYNSATENFDIVGLSETKSYSDLSAHISTDINIIPASVWHGSGYMIPEPTTGMLVMFGFGLLALKRREKVGQPEGRREIS